MDHSASPRMGSGAMFDRIASRYDRLNRLTSIGRDQSWRRKLVAALVDDPQQSGTVLDLATGTADVALLAQRRYPNIDVVGIDPSCGMLQIAAQKSHLTDRLTVACGDGQSLPFRDGTFCASCISFGIRNVPDQEQCLREMARVTRPGGTVAVLEFCRPEGSWLSPAARWYIRSVVPRLGGWISSDKEYRYLAASIAEFPRPDEFCDKMRRAGLDRLAVRGLNFGSVQLYTGRAVVTAQLTSTLKGSLAP